MWPISYDELEPYDVWAEQLYEVHGQRGIDPTEPPASAPCSFPAVSHEPRIQQLSDDLTYFLPFIRVKVTLPGFPQAKSLTHSLRPGGIRRTSRWYAGVLQRFFG